MIPFGVVAALELWLAWLSPWWIAWFLAWAGISTGWVALAYGLGRPRLLGKLDAPMPAGVLLLPFLRFSRAIARGAQRNGVIERQEIVPGLWVGGWPRPGVDALWHVDLTAELPRKVQPAGWVCVPMLDGAPFAAADWGRAVAQAVAWRAEGHPVLVHCAYGHGRSVAVVIGVLLAEGKVATIAEGLARVQAVRPRARLLPGQRRALERAVAKHGTE